MIAIFLFRNPRLLVLAVGLIVTAGLASLYVLPRMEDPVLSQRVALVSTSLAGADAQQVESLVTEKIEQQLRDIQEIKEIRSTSRNSHSVLVIELRDEVVDVDPVWSRVRDRLSDASSELPEESTRPAFRQLKLKAYAAIIALKWNCDGETNYAVLRRLASQLKHEIQKISGTESVDLFGDPGEEIVVEVEPTVLASMELNVGAVAEQVRAARAGQSAGRLRGGSREFLMEVSAEDDSLASLRDTMIQYGAEGRAVPLAEIATIKKGVVRPVSTLALIDETPSVVVGALVRDEHRLDHWTDRLDSSLASFAATLPRGIETDVLLVQNDYVEDRLRHLLGNLLVGTAAVMAVVFLLMGWRSMIVVSVALPLSALMVILGMRALSIPIHQMSITGLIIALGLLIDNAIVIVDEVRSRWWSGLTPVEAIAGGVRHLAMPLFGSTLTTALAFAPIALLPGAPGEFVGAIGVSVILAISSSFFLAMTIVPALTALLQTRSVDSPPERRTFWSFGFSSRALSIVYEKSLRLVFRVPLLGIGLGLILPVLGFLAALQLPEQFFPATDRNQIQMEIELPSSSVLTETRALADVAGKIAAQHSQVSRVHFFLGGSAPTFFYNVMPRRSNSSFYGQAMIELKPGASPRDVARQLQRDLDARLAGARVLVRQLEQGPPFDAPIEIRLTGPDLEVLRQLGSELRLFLSQTPDVLHTRSDLEETLPKLTLDVDPTETRFAGLTERELARQLHSSVEGRMAGSLMEGTEELPIRVRFPDRVSLREIAALELASSRPSGPGRSSPPTRGVKPSGPSLAALARLNLTSDVATIPRVDGQRMNEVKAYVTAGVLPAEVVDRFERRMTAAGFQLPLGYELAYGGEAAKRNEAVHNLLADVAVLVALIVATLVISFRSFRISMIIAAVGGLSIGLGLFALGSFGFPFGFMAILGTMGLVGVAINDAIVVMAGIREHPRARQGNIVALSEVVVGRTRHIVATSLTTIAGFTPLVLGGGGFWPPLAIAIAGGVAGATILALYFVPSLYLLMMSRDGRPADPDTKPGTHVLPATH